MYASKLVLPHSAVGIVGVTEKKRMRHPQAQKYVAVKGALVTVHICMRSFLIIDALLIVGLVSDESFLIQQSDLLSRSLVISRCHISLLPGYERATVVVGSIN